MTRDAPRQSRATARLPSEMPISTPRRLTIPISGDGERETVSWADDRRSERAHRCQVRSDGVWTGRPRRLCRRRGVHQLAGPRAATSAGARTLRTMVASMMMPGARAVARILTSTVGTRDRATNAASGAITVWCPSRCSRFCSAYRWTTKRSCSRASARSTTPSTASPAPAGWSPAPPSSWHQPGSAKPPAPTTDARSRTGPGRSGVVAAGPWSYPLLDGITLDRSGQEDLSSAPMASAASRSESSSGRSA